MSRKRMPEGAKFNKDKCLRCRFHGVGYGGYITTKRKYNRSIFCDYACINNTTCLKPVSTYETEDIRGDDYDNCKLFSSGARDASLFTKT